MSNPTYYAKLEDGEWSVYEAPCRLIDSGIPYKSTALDLIADLQAADAEARAAEIAECDRLHTILNAEGGYVAPDDHAGQGRGRTLDAVLCFIEAHKAGLFDRSLTAAAHDRGLSLVALVEAA